MNGFDRVVRLADLLTDQRRPTLASVEAGKGRRKGDTAMVVIAKPETDSATGIRSNGPPSVRVVEVNPAVAARLLGANTGNRNVRPTVVGRYARDMAAGLWDLNGETIKIATTGRVLDGQHRLHAVVESGVTIQVVVVAGLPEQVQETIDRNLPRNTADALRLRGEVNVIVLAGAIAQTIVMKSDSPSLTSMWPSTKESLAYLEGHPNVRESVNRGEALRHAISYPSTTAAAMHHIFAELDADDADAFFRSLGDGVGLVDDSPILRLRELMIREMSAPRRMSRLRLQALTIKSWNAWRKGTPMLLLKWKTGGSNPETFPRPE